MMDPTLIIFTLTLLCMCVGAILDCCWRKPEMDEFIKLAAKEAEEQRARMKEVEDDLLRDRWEIAGDYWIVTTAERHEGKIDRYMLEHFQTYTINRHPIEHLHAFNTAAPEHRMGRGPWILISAVQITKEQFDKHQLTGLER